MNPPKTDRRHFLQLASVAIGSFGLAVVANKLFSGSVEQTTPISPTSNNSNLKTFNFEVVKTNSQGSMINKSNASARYYEEDLGNGVILEMVEIPGGTFLMGSPESEELRSYTESPQHQVTKDVQDGVFSFFGV